MADELQKAPETIVFGASEKRSAPLKFVKIMSKKGYIVYKADVMLLLVASKSDAVESVCGKKD